MYGEMLRCDYCTFGRNTVINLGVVRNHELEKTCVFAWALIPFLGFGAEK